MMIGGQLSTVNCHITDINVNLHVLHFAVHCQWLNATRLKLILLIIPEKYFILVTNWLDADEHQ